MHHHIYFEYGYSFIAREKATGEERIISTFRKGPAGKYSAIGYSQGYLFASGLKTETTDDPKKEGWRWWTDLIEFMIVDHKGNVLTR